MTEPRAGLYLHLPFCYRVCPYCDFAVRTGDRSRQSRYVDALIGEMALYADAAPEFDTVYFGGGTPSLLEPEELERILEAARRTFRFADDTRVFLEANPEDLDARRLEAWLRLGVGTLSLGVQSFDDAALKALGRAHDAAASRRSVREALDAGFTTVSADLIYGLPDQTLDAWRRDLDAATALGVHHVSCYQLTVHPRTRFELLRRRGELVEQTTDAQADFFRVTHRHLEQRGYAGYEVSQFARAHEHRSRHNMKYWGHVDYLGLGSSAHSLLGTRRWWNLRRTDPYQESVDRGERPVDQQESLDRRDLVLESLMTGLRTHDGVDLAAIRQRWGVDVAEPNGALLDELERQGLVRRERERLIPTLDGLAVADGMAARFRLPGDDQPPA